MDREAAFRPEFTQVIEHGRGGSEASGLDRVLIKAVARGRQWFEDLVNGRIGSLVEIAEAEYVTERYVGRLVPLAFLAPDIVESVLAGTQPVHVTTELLTKRVDLPIDWREQESLLGFERAPARRRETSGKATLGRSRTA